MEITLEQIELVKDRTGVSYKEAKEALEFAGGNVVDAIIYIEENINRDFEKKDGNAVDNIIAALKNAIRSGNVTKIRIYKGDDLILNVPVTVGTIAAVVFPYGVVAAAVASAAARCKVEVVKEDGSVIDINEKAGKAVNTVKDKGGVVIDEIKEKGGSLYESAKTKGAEVINNVIDKGGDILDSAKSATTAAYNEVKEKGAELYESTRDKVSEIVAKGKDEGIIDVTDIDLEEESPVVGDKTAGSDDGIDL